MTKEDLFDAALKNPELFKLEQCQQPDLNWDGGYTEHTVFVLTLLSNPKLYDTVWNSDDQDALCDAFERAGVEVV